MHAFKNDTHVYYCLSVSNLLTFSYLAVGVLKSSYEPYNHYIGMEISTVVHPVNATVHCLRAGLLDSFKELLAGRASLQVGGSK